MAKGSRIFGRTGTRAGGGVSRTEEVTAAVARPVKVPGVRAVVLGEGEPGPRDAPVPSAAALTAGALGALALP